MRASASMPVVSRPVEVEDRIMLDGGIVVSVPYKYMESIGYDRNVIILTQPYGYVKKKIKFLPVISATLKKYPKAIEAMKVRHERYNKEMEEINQREEDGVALVIRPPEDLGIKRTENNPDELERVYQIGRKVAQERIDEIKEFLKG